MFRVRFVTLGMVSCARMVSWVCASRLQSLEDKYCQPLVSRLAYLPHSMRLCYPNRPGVLARLLRARMYSRWPPSPDLKETAGCVQEKNQKDESSVEFRALKSRYRCHGTYMAPWTNCQPLSCVGSSYHSRILPVSRLALSKCPMRAPMLARF